MKKLISLLITLIISCSLFSQNAHPIAVAPTQLNILYVGVDNPVDIAVFGLNPEDISVKIDHGSIKKRGNGKFIVRVPKQGTARITVYTNERNLGNRQFRCKLVPDPYACMDIGGQCIKKEKIDKSLLLKLYGVSAKLDWYFDVVFTVTNFSLRATIDGKEVSEKSPSNKFTLKQKDIIRKAERGSEIFIEDITCIGPDGVVRKLNTIVLKI